MEAAVALRKKSSRLPVYGKMRERLVWSIRKIIQGLTLKDIECEHYSCMQQQSSESKLSAIYRATSGIK